MDWGWGCLDCTLILADELFLWRTKLKEGLGVEVNQLLLMDQVAGNRRIMVDCFRRRVLGELEEMGNW